MKKTTLTTLILAAIVLAACTPALTGAGERGDITEETITRNATRNTTLVDKETYFRDSEVVGNVSRNDQRKPYEVFVLKNDTRGADLLAVNAAWELERERLAASGRVNITDCHRKALLTAETGATYTHVFVWSCRNNETGEVTELSFKKDVRAEPLEERMRAVGNRTRLR